MKKRVLFAAVLLELHFLIFCALNATAQNWSLPKESSEVNWATPDRSYESKLDSCIGYAFGPDITFTLRIPNAFANDAPVNSDPKYTFALANPIPSKGYTTTTFVYGPEGDDGISNYLKTPIVINGETIIAPRTDALIVKNSGADSKARWESLFKLPGGNASGMFNYNTGIGYIVARAKDDPSGNTLILWAVYSNDSRYKR